MHDVAKNIQSVGTVQVFYFPNRYTSAIHDIYNRMAWQWAKTLVEIRGTLVDIRGTTK